MVKHVKPTKQELKEQMTQELAAFEATPADPVDPPVVTPPVVTPPVVVPEVAPVVVPPIIDPAVVTPPVVTPPVEPVVPEVDYRAKFTASSNEAQILSFKTKEIDKAFQESETLPVPGDDEVKAATPGWDDLDDAQRNIARQLLHNQKKLTIINTAREKFSAVDKWMAEVDTFITNPETLVDHPELEGKKEEFKHFANKPERRTMAMEDIILAFVGEQSKAKPVVKKQAMFEQGSGGPAAPIKPVDNRMSLADAEILKRDNYKGYVAALKAGKIKDE